MANAMAVTQADYEQAIGLLHVVTHLAQDQDAELKRLRTDKDTDRALVMKYRARLEALGEKVE